MKWLRLEVRILIALVLAVVGACWALTITTTEWATQDLEAQLHQRAQSAVELDTGWVSDGIETSSGTIQKLTPSSLPGAVLAGAEGLLIPFPTSSPKVNLAAARQYSTIDDYQTPQRIPQCYQPQEWKDLTEVGPGQDQVWTEDCGGWVMGFGFLSTNTSPGPYGWLVAVAMPRDVITDPVPELRATLVNNSVYVVAAAVFIAFVLSAMVVYPLNRSRAMAEAVAGGDVEVRLPVHGHDAIGRMSAAVNTMADRLTGQITELEQANEAQRRFVSDVAHELRTPTAALLASAEALDHPATRDAAAVLVAPQLRRLATLTEDLLEISRLDAGRAHVEPNRVDLMDLLSEVVADCGTPKDVGLVGCFPLEVSTDPARLRVIVRNLVANALQHGSPPVTITADASEERVTVSVTDKGRGVPAELRERVFDRFVRGDEARHGPSSGLGLAIAAENARLLGGTLSLHADGRTFLLSLPS